MKLFRGVLTCITAVRLPRMSQIFAITNDRRSMGHASLTVMATAVLSGVIIPPSALAETVLEKVARTGQLTAGTNQEAFPFAFTNKQGELQGYSVDMLKLIQEQLSQELGKPIELQLLALTPEARIPKLVSGEVDIVCDASSYTWEREKQIDFSVSYGLTGTRLLTKRSNEAWEAQDLVGKRIAAVAGTTNELAMRRAQPKAQIMTVKDHTQGYEAFQQGTVDAFAVDGVLLEGWLQTIDNPENFAVVGYFSKEGIACMMPENNSKFADQVNYTLVRFMDGYLKNKEPYVTTFDRWFGPQAKVPLSKDLRDLALETMQLVIDFKEEIPENEL